MQHTIGQKKEIRRRIYDHTTIRSPSQTAVLRVWSFAGGLPGNTVRIGTVETTAARPERRFTPLPEFGIKRVAAVVSAEMLRISDSV